MDNEQKKTGKEPQKPEDEGKKSAKEGSELFHNIMKASVNSKKKSMESKESEIDLPDGEKAYVLETEWRGYKRYFFDTTSRKFPSFSVTLMEDGTNQETITHEQYTLFNNFIKTRKKS